MCCGAGGVRMWIEEKPEQRVNFLRVEQLLETKAATIASACPCCMTMLSDGVKNKEFEDSVTNRGVLELAADSLVNRGVPLLPRSPALAIGAELKRFS